MADLVTNRPAGFIQKLTGVVAVERGTVRLRFRITDNGEPVDMSVYTVDSAGMAYTLEDTSVTIRLDVLLGADGVVEVRTNLADMSEGKVNSTTHPKGRDMWMWVRLKDPITWPFYLIAPSLVTVRNVPKAGA